MDLLSLFGFAATSLMLLCYALEDRSPWYIVGFAVACALSGVYAVLQGAWPFGMVEGVFTIVALRRFQQRFKAPRPRDARATATHSAGCRRS